MNPVVRAQVKDFSETNHLTERSESEQFEIYSIFSIVNGRLGESIDPIAGHLTGSEFGLDGVAIVVQGRLVSNADEAEEAIQDIRNPVIDFYFTQSKTSTSFDYGEISKFFDAIHGFFDGSMKGESPQLDELISAKDILYEGGIGRRNPGIHAFFCCTGNYDKPARIESLVDATRTRLIDLSIFDPDRIVIELVGAQVLQRLYRAASTAVEVTFDFPKNVVLPDHNDVQQAYIGYISANQLLNIISVVDENNNILEINKSIFFDNIRDYGPDSKINIEIAKSLQDGQSQDFIFRNNGITIVAKSIERTGDRFTIEDYQIVNGCQTSNIIFDNRQFSDQIYVPFRLIGTKKDEFISSIIAGTNRQNPVREDQFWALRPFMKNFEDYCRALDVENRLWFERRENQYRGQKVERARVIQPSVMLKAVAATILGQPHRAARDYRGLISEYRDRLFQDDHDVRPYFAACYLHYRLEFLWRNQRLEPDHKIYRYYSMSAIGRRLNPNRDILGRGRKEVEKFSDNLISISSDEEMIKNAVGVVSKLMTRKLDELKVDTREKLRDAIRAETFVKQFDIDMASVNIGI